MAMLCVCNLVLTNYSFCLHDSPRKSWRRKQQHLIGGGGDSNTTHKGEEEKATPPKREEGERSSTQKEEAVPPFHFWVLYNVQIHLNSMFFRD